MSGPCYPRRSSNCRTRNRISPAWHPFDPAEGTSDGSVLYPNELRLYNDVDLLVEPSQFEAAAYVATTIGFVVRTPVPKGWIKRSIHNSTEVEERALDRGADRVTLDLHRSFHGLRDDFNLLGFLSPSAEEMTISGTAVSVPDPAGVALIALLHATNAKLPSVNSARLIGDVRKCVTNLTPAEWNDVGVRSRQLRIEDVVVSVLEGCDDSLSADIRAAHFNGVTPNRRISTHLRNGSVISFCVWLLTTYSWKRRIVWVALRLPKLTRPTASFDQSTTHSGAWTFWGDFRKAVSNRKK